MKSINVDVGHTKYPIHIEKGLLKSIGDFVKIAFPESRVVLISDDRVFSLYGDDVLGNLKASGVCCSHIVIKQGEGSKSLETLGSLYTKLVELKTSRTDIIIALGGGVVGDLSGFLAATYLRGIEYIQVPTTLLSQVDSSVGGKTAINLKEGKNLVGAFYQPSMVIIDPLVLKTLDDETFAGGMAEIIKMSFIRDLELYNILKNNMGKEKIEIIIEDIIYRSCIDKMQVVIQDERDKGLRMCLNYGHTIAHALEKHPSLNISHGQAVAIGMAQITKAANRLGLTGDGVYEKLIDMLKGFDLPYKMPDCDIDSLLNSAYNDKKFMNDKLNLILIKEIGNSYIHGIDKTEFKEFLK